MKQVEGRIGPERYVTTLSTRDLEWTADEPVDLGGTNAGPTPIEQLLGALGGCILVTITLYTDRKKWPLENAKVVVRAETDKTSKLLGFEYELTLEGDLSDEQRQRIHAISHKCPVHQVLESGAKVVSVGAGH